MVDSGLFTFHEQWDMSLYAHLCNPKIPFVPCSTNNPSFVVVYGVYSSSARVSWPPSKIFGDEITILGSFSETYMFRKFESLLHGCFRRETVLTIRQLRLSTIW